MKRFFERTELAVIKLIYQACFQILSSVLHLLEGTGSISPGLVK